MAVKSAPRASGKRGGLAGVNAFTLRQVHTYIGAFIAPSVLFFALTGSLQLFSLHEAHGGYTPPRLFVQLGSIHKDQRFAKPQRHEPAPPKAAAAGNPDHDDADDHDHDHGHDHPAGTSLRTLALKWLFLTVAAGLAVSTCLGVWMALTFSRRKALVWALLIAGAALPPLILFV